MTRQERLYVIPTGKIIMDRFEKYCIMDIEAIALSKGRHGPVPGRFSRIHHCYRKIGIELWDDSKQVFELVPCIPKHDLWPDEDMTFTYCKNKIHGLNYYPPHFSKHCLEGASIIQRFLKENDIKLVLFKGGNIERDLCYKVGIECIDLETFGVEKAPKALGHDPMREVTFYHHQLKKLLADGYINTCLSLQSPLDR